MPGYYVDQTACTELRSYVVAEAVTTVYADGSERRRPVLIEFEVMGFGGDELEVSIERHAALLDRAAARSLKAALEAFIDEGKET